MSETNVVPKGASVVSERQRQRSEHKTEHAQQIQEADFGKAERPVSRGQKRKRARLMRTGQDSDRREGTPSR